MSNAVLVTKIGALVVFVQNLLFLLGFGATSLFQIVFYVDLIGFLLLGVGLILWGLDDEANKNNLFIAGAMIVLWFVLRVLWQFVLAGGLISSLGGGSTDISAISSLATTLQNMMYAFLLSGFVLVIGSFFLWRTHSGSGTLSFFIYGIINVIAVVMLTYPLLLSDVSNLANAAFMGVLLKMIVVPVVGLVAFLLLFLQYNKVEA